MLVFRSPHFAHLECALARNPYQANQYICVFALRYGMALGREICVINDSTRPWQKLQYSPGSKHPFLWFSPPTAASKFRNDNLLLHGLLAAEPPVIQTTGRTKESSLSAGDLGAQNQVQVLPEVEILLDEEDLARVCYFCFGTEIVYDTERGVRFERLAYGSLYQCMNAVSKMTCLTMPSIPYFDFQCSELSVIRKFWIYTLRWIRCGKFLLFGGREFL
jgi:hypothetical protein